MKKFAMVLLASTALGLGAAHAQNVVERLDPALDALVGPDTKVEKILRRGPVLRRAHLAPRQGRQFPHLQRSDLQQDRQMGPEDQAGHHLSGEYLEGKDKSNAIAQQRNGKDYVQVGSNGQTIDKQGRLVFVAMGSGQVVRREADGKLTVLADKYEGYHLNAPNDLVIKSNGDIYFTDIRANTKSTDFYPPEGVDHTGVYRIHDGKLELLDRTVDAPNGIAFSPMKRCSTSTTSAQEGAAL
jgi:gluconolactonase